MMEHTCQGFTLGDHSKAICTICGSDLSKPSHKELLEAIDRVRELTQEYWEKDFISLYVYLELMKVLNGKKHEA